MSGARGVSCSATEAGPPERMMPFGFSRSKAASAAWKGTISQKTLASRTRRAMSCVHCEPKSTMRMVE